jgi:chromate reductase, NAD(P)H dehydrogenase (quinone)
MPKILAFAGSTRTDSFNKKLVKIAAQGARAAGAEVTYLDLRDLALPLYDGDLEAKEGLPEGAKHLKRLMLDHDGLLISAPEYNSSISAVLKNAIDWATRPAPNELPLACFTSRVAGLLSASPGAFGGLRGLMTVRSILGNIGVIVLPEQFCLPKAHEAFEPDGTLKDARQQAAAERIGATVAKTLAKLAS